MPAHTSNLLQFSAEQVAKIKTILIFFKLFSVYTCGDSFLYVWVQFYQYNHKTGRLISLVWSWRDCFICVRVVVTYIYIVGFDWWKSNLFDFSFDELLFDCLQFWLTSIISFASISSWWTHPQANKQRNIFFTANVYEYFIFWAYIFCV